MSQGNAGWVRQVAQAWERGDVERMKALFRRHLSADFELHPLYLDRVYKGYEGMQELWADISQTWEDYRLRTEEVVELGEHVLVLGQITGRGAGSGVPIDQGLALLCAFEGERAVWAKAFTSKRDAIEAAALRAEESPS
jgi:ketosteroid isomerase-like protein